MAEFESLEFKTSFTVPDTLTVRQQLTFRGAAALAGGDMFVRFWAASKTIIENWESEIIPDMNDYDIDEASDPLAADVIQWTGTLISGHIAKLGTVPKNA